MGPLERVNLWRKVLASDPGHDPLAQHRGSRGGQRYVNVAGRFVLADFLRTVLSRVVVSDSPMTPDYAWAHREGRNTRYDNKRVGGTVCVHFIKKNMWFLETATAFLGMQDTTELEMHPSEPNEEEGELPSSGHAGLDAKKSRTRTGYPPGYREGPDLSVPVDLEPDLVDPDAEEEHDPPIESAQDMHALFFQGGAEELDIDVEGGGKSGYLAYPQTDEPERSEDLFVDDSKREIASDAHGEPEGEETTLSPAGHFANGSRKVYKR